MGTRIYTEIAKHTQNQLSKRADINEKIVQNELSLAPNISTLNDSYFVMVNRCLIEVIVCITQTNTFVSLCSTKQKTIERASNTSIRANSPN